MCASSTGEFLRSGFDWCVKSATDNSVNAAQHMASTYRFQSSLCMEIISMFMPLAWQVGWTWPLTAVVLCEYTWEGWEISWFVKDRRNDKVRQALRSGVPHFCHNLKSLALSERAWGDFLFTFPNSPHHYFTVFLRLNSLAPCGPQVIKAANRILPLPSGSHVIK